MSVTFNSKSGAITADGCDLTDGEYGDRFPRSVWWIGAAAVCLGLLYLLLLGIILAMVAQHIGTTPHKDIELLLFRAVGCDNLTSQCLQLQNRYHTLLESNNQVENKLYSLTKEKDTVTGERDTLQNERNTLRSERDTLKNEQESLRAERDTLHNAQEALKKERDTLQTEQQTLRNEKEVLKIEQHTIQNEKETLQNERDAIMRERDSLRDELDRLKLVSSNLTKELEVLQSQFNTMVELHQNRTEKLCPSDWVKFQEKCYYISEKGKALSWQASRSDCQGRGGDLAIITTKEEQDFITPNYDRRWIGLSDLDREGEWKWVNGDNLNFKGFWQKGQPSNTDRDEDCAEVSRAGNGWNDMPCRTKLSWVCED
ncbi:low affinity immunoglobulin epsilon Fc receptor-like [Dunckerocampus dactyliophorus]|uniref:low affinity immunoglobulin epsilon Fc receptor-like n=1 Tax=Dunckerocampus dactyliophorus TaxID=161453 RepID=UPI0024076CBC|nr:low affinity immunoglobulin epsilon Fc receptor-like [Dunckerocampus dactyliophorus]